MIKKVLIANRGEIAVRVAAACHQLGLRSVAVFSDVDRDAVHVSATDEALRIGPAPATQSYLDVAAIVAAAQQCGADAIHPGYGFLSENPAFAAACARASIAFIGPPAQVLALVGDKVTARRTVQAAGVPVVPGLFESTSDLAALERAATELGPPLLIKASGGGGGIGMRRVTDLSTLRAALEAASAEAQAAFGKPELYCEKLLEQPRHVEVQILADQHGHVIALGERECSIQRRHQKLIEESPSPAVDADLRNALCAAAVQVARSAGYIGAGTVEFLLTADRRFYFLEVNARIQVEHGVTEARFGLDLVAWQLRIAQGEPLDPLLGQRTPLGWSMEARIYAEDPATGFLPSAGRIERLELPAGPGIRVDTGVAAGSMVPLEYDPILAKVIAHADDRESCRRRLHAALGQTVVLGVASNAAFLRNLIDHPLFRQGALHTRLLDETIAADLAAVDPVAIEAALIAAALELDAGRGSAEVGASRQAMTAVAGPWQLLRGTFPTAGEP